MSFRKVEKQAHPSSLLSETAVPRGKTMVWLNQVGGMTKVMKAHTNEFTSSLLVP